MISVRQFEGEDRDSHSHSGSDCSADQEKLSWRGFEAGVGGVASLAAQLALPPSQLEFGQSGVCNGRGVWTKSNIPSGTRFGPFLGKWVLEPENEEFAWEVLVPSAGIRGFLDASEFGTWLKFVRTSKEKHNMKHLLLGGQIFYETIRDVPGQEELLLEEKHPIQLDGGEDPMKQEDDVKSISQDEDETTEFDESGVKCLVCDKSFPDVYILDKHMIESHRYEADKYICEHCNKGFAWRPNLLRHKMVHGEFRRFPCENCDKVFTDPSNLQRHIRTSHVGARCHACPECGKTFATSSGLKQHTHIHSSVKPFRCEVCYKAYTQFSNLCRHKRMHANCRMQIKCHKCGQAFSTVTSLSKHRRFCDSTPSPFLPGHAQPPRLPPLDQPADLGANGGSHFSPFNNKFGSSPFLQPPFTNHLQNLFGGPGAPGGNFPFLQSLQSPHMMFPTMLQRMALSQLNGKSLLSPSGPTVTNGSNICQPAESKLATPGPVPGLENNNSPATPDVKNIIDMKTSLEGIKSIEEFRQKLMNGHLDKNSHHHKNGLSSSDIEKSSLSSLSSQESKNQQKLLADVKPEIEENPGDLSTETTSGFDVNRNKSDKDKPKVLKPGEVTAPVPAPAPLDLSTPRKMFGAAELVNDSNSDIGEESGDSLSPAEQCRPLFSNRIEEKTRTKETNERPESPGENPSHQSENTEEPRGFKPVGSGKSFIPVTEVSLFPKTTTTPESTSAIQTSPFHRPSPLFSPAESNLPFPRPVNPFLLGAMYRMNQNPYSAFHPSMSSSSLPPIAPRPLPFSSPFINPMPSSPFLPSSLPLLGRLGCYSDVLTGGQKSKDRYGCKFCGKVFPRSANLTRHLRTHTGEQPYKCKYCERSFSISSNLQRHVRNIHNKEKPFKCPLCERCFGQQTNLDRHLKKHETCSDPSEIVDSPESMKTDEDMGYFDEIRSFMGKVVDKNCSLDTSENEVDVEEDDDIIADMD